MKSIIWFRKGLRLHDNPSLLAAIDGATNCQPLFILDPWFLTPERVGHHRMRFLLETLTDLDASLKQRNSRLIVLHGNPKEVLPAAIKAWGATRLCFEFDSEPYARVRDEEAAKAAAALGCDVKVAVSHTLYDPRAIVARCGGKGPVSYQGFLKVAREMGPPPKPAADPPAALPPPLSGAEGLVGVPHGIPANIAALGYPPVPEGDDRVLFKGGETEGLKRLRLQLARKEWLRSFEKPNTAPTDLVLPLRAAGAAGPSKPANPFEAAKKAAAGKEKKKEEGAAGASASPTVDELLTPATTALSPYFKFGCVSARLFYHELMSVLKEGGGKHTAPPVSLEGQMLWREFFYACGWGTPNFDKMARYGAAPGVAAPSSALPWVGNPVVKQIGWDKNPELLAAWAEGRTGYPWIDAAMTQLRTQGWLHHLARHAVACFLTRGDLYQHWEEGVAVFDRLLLDADWSLNNGNWQWLSASAFFAQYFRVYSPVAFPKKTDKSGAYVRHFLPVLAKFPDKYIYEPWTAPLSVQKEAGCIIGKDYPAPIVDHAVVSKANIGRIAEAYKAHKAAHGGGAGDEDEEDGDEGDAGGGKGKSGGAGKKKWAGTADEGGGEGTTAAAKKTKKAAGGGGNA